MSNPSPYTRQNLELRAAEYYTSIRKPESEWKSIEDLAPQLAEFEHRINAEDYDNACQLTNVIDPNYLFLWGYYARLVEMRRALIGKLPSPNLRASNLGRLGYTYRKSWKLELAEDLTREALKIYREAGDRLNECFWLGELGRVYRAQGEIEHAINLYKDALKIAREIDARPQEGFQLGHLGSAYLTLGQLDRAKELYQKVLLIADEINDEQMRGKRLGSLGHIYYDEGKLDLSIEYCEQALRIAQKIGDRRNEGAWFGYLSRALLAKGNLTEAQRCCEDALALGIPEISYRVVLMLGIVLLHQQKYSAAHEVFIKAARSCQAMLAETPRLYLSRYVLATALAGQAVSNPTERQNKTSSELLTKALTEYQRAIDTCAAHGVIQDFLHYLKLIRAAGIEGLEPVFKLLEDALGEQP
jgi:tetratricopeptide (TPR) repeat protein